jgi:5-methylcytosine-specific restriction protein A
MPNLMRACRGQFGRCPNVVQGEAKFCQECAPAAAAAKAERQREYNAKRGSARRLGYTHHWEKVSKFFLARHPLCMQCESEGRLTQATEVHHIVPRREDPTLFFDANNLCALCKRCHSSATSKENAARGEGRGNR